MPPRDSDRPSSPLPKRLQSPLPPSPHRTTSQLSAVSVETSNHESSPRRPTRPDLPPSAAAEGSSSPALSVSSPVEVPITPSRARTGTSTPSSSRRTSLFESGLNGSTSGSGSPAIRGGVLSAALAGKSAGGGSGLRTPGGASVDEGSSGSSRKGKERMVLADEAEVEDLDVAGELVQTGEDARKGLRELFRRSMAGESNLRTSQRHGDSQQGMIDTRRAQAVYAHASLRRHSVAGNTFRLAKDNSDSTVADIYRSAIQCATLLRSHECGQAGLHIVSHGVTVELLRLEDMTTHPRTTSRISWGSPRPLSQSLLRKTTV
jgi:hypothetical protein